MPPDPVAELLRSAEVLKPRPVYRAALRTDLMRRPPVGPGGWRQALGGNPFAALLVMILALAGLGSLYQQRLAQPLAEPESEPLELSEAPARESGPEAPAAQEHPAGVGRFESQSPDAGERPISDEGGAAADIRRLPLVPALAETALPTPAEPEPKSPADEDQKPRPAPPTPTSPAPPTGVAFDEPDPGPTETAPVSSGRATRTPPPGAAP